MGEAGRFWEGKGAAGRRLEAVLELRGPEGARPP